MDKHSLTLLLAERLLALYGKERLAAILASVKATPGVSRRAFRAAGNSQELLAAIPAALEIDQQLPARLAAAIDEIEENGAQHIFLFDLAHTSGKHALSPKRFQSISELPLTPSPSLYSGIPTSPKLYRRNIDDGLIVKQIRRATYEEYDHESPESGGRAVYYRTVETRAVNLLRIDFARGEAEIRIDRARDRQDDDLAIKLYQVFVRDLRGIFDIWESLAPIPVWDAFPRILAARDETHMATENAVDESMRIRLASRREEDRGMDVRDHKSYVAKARRKSLRIYWNVPDDTTAQDASPKRYIPSYRVQNLQQAVTTRRSSSAVLAKCM